MRPGIGAYVLDDHGEPLAMPDTLVWAQWMETADRRVALTRVGDGTVSTVFLGLDHGYSWCLDGTPEPVLWETMTFDVPGLDQDCQRYTSRQAAVLGHADAVVRAQAAIAIASRSRA